MSMLDFLLISRMQGLQFHKRHAACETIQNYQLLTIDYSTILTNIIEFSFKMILLNN